MPTYKSTGAPQIITIGNGAGYDLAPGLYDITAYGAQGGNGQPYAGTGGKGAEEGGDIILFAGEKLKVVVGSSPGYSYSTGSGGGGGGTFVLANSGSGYAPLLVAGGGGGAYQFDNGGDGTVGAPGSGGGAGAYAQFGGGGGGAGVKAAGTAGSNSSKYAVHSGGGGSNGPSYQGGAGGYTVGSYATNGGFGGGGGGGLTGGGGGSGYAGGPGGGSAPGTGGTSFHTTNGTNFVAVPGQHTGNGLVQITAIVCFATGTLIRTVRGEAVVDVAVEDLAIGDRAITASGAARPIRWLGHRTIDCRAQAQPRDVWPIRVAAHAFGDGLPSADLFLSAGHAVRVRALDDVLIPIGKLINGATIARHPVDEVTYWHVELDSHDVLIANGLPAESFLDCGNREGLIEQTGDYDRLKGPHTPADFCLPFIDKGPTVEAVRDRLAARAAALGWTMTHDTDLHLLVDGVRVDPDVLGSVARFVFPTDAKHVVLASATQVPSDIANVLDHRRLGVSIHGLEIDDGLGERVRLPLDDARLAAGWHPQEAATGHAHRFTKGQLPLPASLFAGCRGQVVLRVHHDPQGAARWLAPADGAAEAATLQTNG